MPGNPLSPETAETIDKVRKLTRKLGAEVASHGVHEPDILIGIAYGLHDLTLGALGSPQAAIEWQRTALDLVERGHLEGNYPESGDAPYNG